MTVAEAIFSGVGVAVLLAVLTFGAWIVKKISTHDTALAILVQTVNPPNGKSLRDLMQEFQLELVRSTGSKSTET